jgi:hypothetical protein
MGPWLIDVYERDELERWLGDTAAKRVLMVVPGDSSRLREILPNLLDAAKLQPNRVVLWVKDPALLAGLPVAEVFAHDDRIVAVVLAGARAASWVYDDQVEVVDATFAFEKADRA